MMTFDGHTPIISYHINTIFFNPSSGKIPVAREADIRFLDLLPVNIKPPGTKFNLFALSSDHAFQKHDPAAGKSYGHHIMSFGLRKERAQSPTKVDASIGIGWLHTDPLNRERNAEKTEKKISAQRDQKDPDQEHGRQRGEKEFPNSPMDNHLGSVRKTFLFPLTPPSPPAYRQAGAGERRRAGA
jgi:hypothetical protein